MTAITDNTTRFEVPVANKQIVGFDQEKTLSMGDIDLTAHDLTACLADIKKQNEDALSRLYDQTINSVYGLALRITGQAEEAEEVVSDVYFQVWEQAHRYQTEKGSIMTWILTICRSRAIDRLRKRQQSNPELSASINPDLIAVLVDPEYLLSNIQQHSLIHQALQKLSSIQRQLLSLAFFRGMTYQEIADTIGMPLGTVKSHIRRSLIALKAESSLQFCYSIDEEMHHG